MKTLKYLFASVIAVVLVVSLSSVLQAEGLRHLVWQSASTNYLSISSTDSTNTVNMINGPQAGHVRLWAYIANTNSVVTAKGLLVKLGGLYPTTGTPDVTIPPGTSHTFYFGEGYNGQISVRNVGTTTVVPFLYWEGGY